MRYHVTARISIGKESTNKRSISLEAETPLSVKQLKEQCLEKLKIDTNKYTKVSEEVWQRGVHLDEANLDTDVLDKVYHKNPDYYLSLIKRS